MYGAGSTKRREAQSHDLGGRQVAGGAATRDQAAHLLGIDSVKDRFRVTAAAWIDHALEVAVSGDGAILPEPVVFRMERRGPASAGLVVTERLNVFSRGTAMPAALAEAVETLAPARLASLGTDDLARLVQEDPEAGTPGLPMPPRPSDEVRPGTLLDTWGAPDSHADFFAGGEMARSQLDSVDPSKIFHFVQHCDAECLYVNPHSVGTVVTVINFPWDDRIREPSRPFDQGLGNIADRDYIAEGMITSDLDEEDVIMGSPEKLDRLLERATSRESSDERLIFFSNTCVPTVIGEDVESRVERAREESGQPILYLTVTPRSMTNVFQSVLVDKRLEAEAAAPAPDPRAVNLVGFAPGRARDELEEALGQLGLRVNARLLPDLTMELVRALPGASLGVFYPNELWQHLYDQLLDRSRTPHLAQPAPWGFEGSRAWLARIVGELGAGEGFDAWWERYSQPFRARWDALRSEAAGCRLGFVVRDSEHYHLTQPSATWGVPLIAIAEEMGFGVDVLVHASSKRETRRAAEAVHATFREPDRHRIRAFTDFPMLRERLADSTAHAFFTYHFFDWRLSEAGKGAFSIQSFEMGVPGAVRTLERLVRVCKTPFYRRFGKYLGRTATGLRQTERGDD